MNIYGRLEGVLLIVMSAFIFYLIVIQDYSLIFNPTYKVLAIINANLMFLTGIFSVTRPSNSSSLSRVIIYIIMVIFILCYPVNNIVLPGV